MSTLRTYVTNEQGRELGFAAQVAAAQEAWTAAIAAIDEAWRLTPDVALKQRATIQRGARNQGVAHRAATAMRSNLIGMADAIDRSARARAEGKAWAADSDEAAAQQWLERA